jgi:hypothetical protein
MAKLHSPALPLAGGCTWSAVRFAITGIRWLLSVRKAGWELLSCAGEGGIVGRYPLPDWLRQDLGLTEDDVKSQSDRINETRQIYYEWL